MPEPEEFDPYVQWLGIRSRERPPNHYALLGLDRFEGDTEVIQNAADQRMRHVRKYRTSKRVDLAERLLNEISQAKLCLLNETAREKYDQWLRTPGDLLESIPVPPPVPDSFPGAAVEPPPFASAAAVQTHPKPPPAPAEPGPIVRQEDEEEQDEPLDADLDEEKIADEDAPSKDDEISDAEVADEEVETPLINTGPPLATSASVQHRRRGSALRRRKKSQRPLVTGLLVAAGLFGVVAFVATRPKPDPTASLADAAAKVLAPSQSGNKQTSSSEPKPTNGKSRPVQDLPHDFAPHDPVNSERPPVESEQDEKEQVREFLSDGRGLVVGWHRAFGPQAIVALTPEKFGRIELAAKDSARIDESGRMRLAGGSYIAFGAEEPLLAACRRTNEFAIEVHLAADNTSQSGPARIVSFSTDAQQRNFTLGQEHDWLILRLRTPQTGDNGTNTQVGLCQIKAGEPSHVVVSYAEGRLHCFLNGQRVLESDDVRGDFSNWSRQWLVLGDEYNGQRDWSGSLERVAIFNRTIGPVEAARRYQIAK